MIGQTHRPARTYRKYRSLPFTVIILRWASYASSLSATATAPPPGMGIVAITRCFRHSFAALSRTFFIAAA